MDGDVTANDPEHVPLSRQGVVIRGRGLEGDKTWCVN